MTFSFTRLNYSINKSIRLGSNLETVTVTDGLRQVKDENRRIFTKNSQNVTLASTFCHIILIDLVIILLV